jgi:lipopolysaccharide/colanic/teichoic acid biosynthesis glycosyltransferase
VSLAFQNEPQPPEEVFSDFPFRVLRWKRVLDVVLILLALPLLVPLVIVVAALIRIVSAGPVLFKQERVGYLGRRFMCFKFRTMFVGADAVVHQGHLHQLMNLNTPMTKMDSEGDPRIIPFGRLLRASGLDELPQLINVLRAEMSLVGPRPCLPYEYEKYLPWQKERFASVPGLTGLWQVSGKNRTTFVEMIHLDIRYAREKSVWFDISILLRTLPALVIQVFEMRYFSKMVSRSNQSGTALSRNHPTPSYSAHKSAFAEIVRAERQGRLDLERNKPKL